ncbi:MAG: choice-of-anchor tandem repeat GloVer-containing protein [Candidatus Korobacteraceae bacterium]
MERLERCRRWIGDSDLWTIVAAMAVALLMILAATEAHAQTLTVLHSFTGGADGGQPYAGLSMDRAANFYGTTTMGGAGYGTVYRLKRSGSGWIFTPLYAFQGGTDGSYPFGGVVSGPDGTLYGTAGGGPLGYGEVYNLRPPATICKAALCPWTKTTIYSFTANEGGPLLVNLTFDQSGNSYGTTSGGGVCPPACGEVFELTRSNGAWSEAVLYSFGGVPDGSWPYSGVTFDSAGNLYGTTSAGGSNYAGAVFKLSPSGTGWTETIIHNIDGTDGDEPYGGVTFDASGNLYGTTFVGGPQGGGTAFELTPSNGGWTFTLLQGFNAYEGSYATPTLDAQGNLYGTLSAYNFVGEVFKLTDSNGSWSYQHFHDFSGNDGYIPLGAVVFDANGNLYGTTYAGGGSGCGGEGCGAVYEITP